MTNWPSHVYWIAPDRSWLFARCFHLHPLAVRGRPEKIDINTTIDGDYLVGLGVGVDDLYVCQDFDEVLCVEISPLEKKLKIKFGRFSKFAFILFFLANCNALHRAFFFRAIRWRGELDVGMPEAVTSQAQGLTATVAHFSPLAPIVAEIRKYPMLWKIARLLNPAHVRDFINVRYERLFKDKN